MAWHKPFTEHPASVGESYGEHWLAAMGFGLRMLAASLACMVHAFLPGLFTRTGSRAIERLHDRMVVNRRRRGGAQPIGAVASKSAR